MNLSELFLVSDLHLMNNRVEEMGIGVAFSILLLFVLAQYRKLWEQLSDLHIRMIRVVEQNTIAYIELKGLIENRTRIFHKLIGAQHERIIEKN